MFILSFLKHFSGYFYPVHTSRYLVLTLLLLPVVAFTQQKDTTVLADGNYITLSDIIVNQNLDVNAFIRRIKEDTTFYKAFKNLHILGFTSINDIRMLDNNGKIDASLKGTIRQVVSNHCRHMEVLKQAVTGDFYDASGDYNYYTAAMYAQLFFTKGTICNENNIVGNKEFSTGGLSGIEKHKAQLKMLFFNPGKRISGLPFISNKTAIFDKGMADNYDMKIDFQDFGLAPSYVFTVKVKKGKENNVVIKEMVTWFDVKNFDILARNYSLSYNAGVYDFDVDMKIKMTKVADLVVPSLITYNGNWKVLFKKRERGVFTATLSGFYK